MRKSTVDQALETPRLRLRLWRPEDVEPLAAIIAEPAVHRWLGPAPLPPDFARTAIDEYMRSWTELRFGRWAMEEKTSGRLIGRVGLSYADGWQASDDKVEIGWAVASAYWGRGLATEGALAALEHGFEVVGLSRIISFTLPDNAPSRRVMEKCGLTYQGAATWAGLPHVWYAIGRAEWDGRKC